MVWGGKGRSGIGDTNIQGTWEDWDGLSPNGRQYKNKLTQETRNLSGNDYWHLRKADFPGQLPDTLPASMLYDKNGNANLSHFKEAEVSNVDKALDYLEGFALKKKASFRLCEEALDILDDILTDITREDRNRLYLRLTDMRRDAYRATLSPEQRSENDAKDLREYILSLSLEERRDKYGPLCRNLGIPYAKEKGAQNMNIIDLLWKVLEYGLIAVFIIYVFYIA